MITIEFAVPGPPAPWHVFTRWDKSPSKARLKAYQDLIRVHARLAMGGRDPYDGPVDLSIDFFRAFPASVPKGMAPRKRWAEKHILARPDTLNLAKGAEDALIGVVFRDDSQVIKERMSKWYSDGGETVFIVRFL